MALNLEKFLPQNVSTLEPQGGKLNLSKFLPEKRESSIPKTYKQGFLENGKLVLKDVTTGSGTIEQAPGPKTVKWPTGTNWIRNAGMAAYQSTKGLVTNASKKMGEFVNVLPSSGYTLNQYEEAPTSSWEERQKYFDSLKKTTTLDRAVKFGEAVVAMGSLSFTQVMAELNASKELPGPLSLPAKGVDWGFQKLGQAGQFVSDKGVDFLPISKEAKDTIRPLADELGAFIGQLVGIKAVHGLAKTGGGKIVEKLPISEKTKTGIKTGVQFGAGMSMQPFSTAFNLGNGMIMTKIAERKAKGVEVTPEETQKIIEEVKQELPEKIEIAEEKKIDLNKFLPKNTQPAENPLAQEARKYKTAEEFVKAKATLLHGGKEEIAIFKPQEARANSVYLTPAEDYAKTFAGKNGKITNAYFEPQKPFRLKDISQDGIIESPNSYTEYIQELKAKGYDSIISRDKRQIMVLSPENIKTKSQLTDIWNEANGGVKERKTRLPEIKEQTIRPESKINDLKLQADELAQVVEDSPLRRLSKYESKKYPGELVEVTGEKGFGVFKKQGDAIVKEVANDLGHPEWGIEDVSLEYTKYAKTRDKLNELKKLLREAKQETFIDYAQNDLEKINKILQESVSGVDELRPEARKAVSGVAKSIEAKAVERGLIEKGYNELAEYNPVVIKEQAKMASDLINTDLEKAKRIALGQESLPEGLKGSAILSAMEDYAMKTRDGELARELANSPLVSEVSVAGQTLRLAAEREPDSATARIKELKKEREAVAEKKLKGRKPKEVQNEIKNSLEEKIKKTKPNKYSWESLLNEITC